MPKLYIMKPYAYYLSFALILLLTENLAAQEPWGIQSSNYGGIYRLDLQPASLADNRIKLEVNLVGASVDVWSDYIKFPGRLVTGFGARDLFGKTNDVREIFFEELNGNSKNFFLQL